MTRPREEQPKQPQTAPVRMYQTDGRIMVAVPLAGLEPGDISVTVRGDKVAIHGQLRGPRQDERDLLLAEWAIGPYSRELTLPQAVDGALTNATYGNGVLVLAMPKALPTKPGTDGDFRLEVLQAPRGERVGHTGRERRETTTAEHRQRRADTARGAGQRQGARPSAEDKGLRVNI